jgi:multidrug resistance protein, MATE family
LTLNKEIFRIAIPNIIANISIPLLGIVDTALMGRMDDPAYIGAIALGGIIFNILYWGLGFLRPGTTGLTAQSYGKNDYQECYRLLYRSSIIGFSLGLIILIFHKQLGHFCFGFLSGSEQVESLAYEYFSIRVLAAPVVICLFALRGWFFGMQDAISPMILTISANVLNIIFSWYLVMELDMAVAGVAYGTMAAQFITFLVAVIIIVVKYKSDVIKYFDSAVFKAKEMLRFLSINRDMFIRNLCMILVFSFFTDYSSQIDDDYLAINQMLLQLFYFMAYSVDGFAYASESLVGKYLGAQSIVKVKEVIKKCLIYGLGFGALFSVGFILSGSSILRIMTTNAELIKEAQPYFIWLAMVSISGALAFIWDGVYSGATVAKELRDSMLISTIFFFLIFYSTKNSYPEIAIWAAMVAFMLSRSVFQIILYKVRIEKQWESLENKLS